MAKNEEYHLKLTNQSKMSLSIELNHYGIQTHSVIRNASPARLYEEAIRYEKGATISDRGALILKSGEKTGRSPKDKRIIEQPESSPDIWWGKINIKMDEHTFDINRQRVIDYYNTRERLYVVDGYAGWDPEHQIKVRVICTRPYHALFMHNMLIRPTEEQLLTFGEPDYVIYNGGEFPANRYTSHMNSGTSIDLCFEKKEFVILGTEYAGEMKKGIFTIMNYIMPKKGILSMHCSANEGKTGDVSLFFGLSGTGKTTLSADINRKLIGDDEHCWTDKGIFNIEGGCYAKTVDLSEEKEPEIFNAIKFGTVLENVVFDEKCHTPDYSNTSITENTRAAYPLDFIHNAKIPAVGNHPKNIIFLTCDAYGVFPPVAELTPEQAMYHFISGYTAKVAGTEMGITEPSPTFSACFGEAFMVWHPSKYAQLLAEKMEKHQSKAWLVNTGWVGGAYGTGNRIKLKYTRAIIDAIHNGSLNNAEKITDQVFGLRIPVTCENVPSEIMIPENRWSDKEAYKKAANNLAGLFKQNFEQYTAGCDIRIVEAGPQII
jgi:phosphoenolpyruvate carboxykinase (ATP)